MNQVSSISHSSIWLVTYTILAKTFRAVELLPKYCKTFDSPEYFIGIRSSNNDNRCKECLSIGLSKCVWIQSISKCIEYVHLGQESNGRQHLSNNCVIAVRISFRTKIAGMRSLVIWQDFDLQISIFIWENIDRSVSEWKEFRSN